MSRFPVRELGEIITVLGNNCEKTHSLLFINVVSCVTYLASSSRVKSSPFLAKVAHTYMGISTGDFLQISNDLLSINGILYHLLETGAPMFWILESFYKNRALSASSVPLL